ncbi:FMN-dependent NADH-azoreductase [Magnetospirillum molischianum]|uniref:FMN dependent NADH:quinone oxidoreductase n=1 Tax=Magnetospirillum molischianum DSM 120 TaxID=1150626 RepID=H8FP95_MAGML|nr:FMN-dependent NADH-azoreductase [Magnetospirillum molischianum]CCG40183.1 FMN-dependent NADH-azoreductase [Magnetospirillum molischianum DSM 120]
MNVLQIDSSSLADASVSRQLTQAIVTALAEAHPDLHVTRLDLVETPPPHLTSDLTQVVKFRNLDNLTSQQREELARTDALVDQFLAADIVVIGAPMYNFSIPTQLKAWIDRVSQAGRTFRYTENGPIGLAGGRKVIIASARGGRYAGMPFEAALDHQEAYLRAILGFWGVTDISIIRAEGVAMGADARAEALDAARRDIPLLVQG